MKIFLLLIAIVSSIFGVTINQSLLKVHATLVPKISLMDYKFQEKLKNSTITIAILYNDSEYKDAKSLKMKIDVRYKKGIKSYKVESKLISYKNVNNAEANIYYLFPAKEKDIKRTVTQANKNSALTFSYLRDDLKYGVMISLSVSKKIKPILNLDAIRTYNIALRPVLIDISTIYINNTKSILDHLDIRGFNDFKIYSV